MGNLTANGLPSLPSYTLTPRPSMIGGVPDVYLQLLAPIVVYWLMSAFFQLLDSYDLFPQYRLHTPVELTKRNHVSKYEVFRDVILQQIIQTIAGLVLAHFDPPEMMGKQDYDIAQWALLLRRVEMRLPVLLALFGLDAPKIAGQIYDKLPALAGAISGGNYPTPGFQRWELTVGEAIYWVGVPIFQFVVAVMIVDTWQYFLHRAMHMNKFLYVWLHARHHRLYVPYAFGALYNHPIEGFLLDTAGTGLAYLVTGMTVRQGLWFFTCSTIKTVDDHCGYAFPWDPLQHFTDNNAAYHDVHHQSWGIKTNFSQPFSTFWDRLLGTTWSGGDVSLRYERARNAAQKKVDEANQGNLHQRPVAISAEVDPVKAQEQFDASRAQFLESGVGDTVQILQEEAAEEQAVRRNARRRQSGPSGFDPKAISDKVSDSLYGRRTPILHAD